MIPSLGFLLLASRNAVNDVQSGLITSQGELLASLSRAWLYLLAPMLLIWLSRLGPSPWRRRRRLWQQG